MPGRKGPAPPTQIDVYVCPEFLEHSDLLGGVPVWHHLKELLHRRLEITRNGVCQRNGKAGAAARRGTETQPGADGGAEADGEAEAAAAAAEAKAAAAEAAAARGEVLATAEGVARAAWNLGFRVSVNEIECARRRHEKSQDKFGPEVMRLVSLMLEGRRQSRHLSAAEVQAAVQRGKPAAGTQGATNQPGLVRGAVLDRQREEVLQALYPLDDMQTARAGDKDKGMSYLEFVLRHCEVSGLGQHTLPTLTHTF